MALFKILKGRHNKLNTQAKTDGWAWFTPDNGAFYIDAMNTTNTEIERIEINPKSIVIENTVPSSLVPLWDNNQVIITDEMIKENYNGYITVNSSDFSVLRAAALANLHITKCNNGSLLLQARGEKPAINIPITITLVPAPAPIYYNVIFGGTHANHAYVTNHSTKIKENESCNLTIQLNTNYSRYTITALMGDVEIFYLREFAGGEAITLNIPNVTDNIEITVNGTGAAEPS